jgi:hypothetical protein
MRMPVCGTEPTVNLEPDLYLLNLKQLRVLNGERKKVGIRRKDVGLP